MTTELAWVVVPYKKAVSVAPAAEAASRLAKPNARMFELLFCTRRVARRHDQCAGTRAAGERAFVGRASLREDVDRRQAVQLVGIARAGERHHRRRDHQGVGAGCRGEEVGRVEARAVDRLALGIQDADLYADGIERRGGVGRKVALPAWATKLTVAVSLPAPASKLICVTSVFV